MRIVVEGSVRGLEGREILALILGGLLFLRGQVDFDHPNLVRGDVIWECWRGGFVGAASVVPQATMTSTVVDSLNEYSCRLGLGQLTVQEKSGLPVCFALAYHIHKI